MKPSSQRMSTHTHGVFSLSLYVCVYVCVRALMGGTTSSFPAVGSPTPPPAAGDLSPVTPASILQQYVQQADRRGLPLELSPSHPLWREELEAEGEAAEQPDRYHTEEEMGVSISQQMSRTESSLMQSIERALPAGEIQQGDGEGDEEEAPVEPLEAPVPITRPHVPRLDLSELAALPSGSRMGVGVRVRPSPAPDVLLESERPVKVPPFYKSEWERRLIAFMGAAAAYGSFQEVRRGNTRQKTHTTTRSVDCTFPSCSVIPSLSSTRRVTPSGLPAGATCERPGSTSRPSAPSPTG